jgi:hypothetical protein
MIRLTGSELRTSESMICKNVAVAPAAWIVLYYYSGRES